MTHGWGRHIDELTIQDLTAFNKVNHPLSASASSMSAVHVLSNAENDYQLTRDIAPPTQHTNIPHYPFRYENCYVSRSVPNQSFEGLPHTSHQSGRRHLRLHSRAGHHHRWAVQSASLGDNYLPRECRAFACGLEHCFRPGSGRDTNPDYTQIGHLDKAKDLGWVSLGCGFSVSIRAPFYLAFSLHSESMNSMRKIIDLDSRNFC